MGSITVPDRVLQRQKKPSVTRVFCKLRPSFLLSRQLLGPFGEVSGTGNLFYAGAWFSWLERLPVTLFGNRGTAWTPDQSVAIVCSITRA